ncbi:MATE family efflux transporter [Limisalsivibrio acetivorans]|uniref:MATE family efflux transporter n=1 Tax=Limisalsivibrio acetivorans TaxID=1304888 RepID=UPI0003B536F6|nr:MATE family efflux transporter [Limisalsivibrio acetivorans]
MHNLMGMLQSMVDMIFVGRISPMSVAAVGVGMQYIGLLYAAMSLFYVGTNALVSRFVGAERPEDAGRVTANMFGFALVFSIPIFLFGLTKAAFLFNMLGIKGEVAAIGSSYMSIFSFTVPLLFMQGVLYSSLNAYGKTKLPFYIGIFGNIVNTILDYGLIFGNLGMPEMGVEGAAWATVFTKCVELSIYIYICVVRKEIVITPKFAPDLLKRAIKVGFPTWMERMLTFPSYLVLSALIAKYSTEALAGYQIGLRVEGLAFMPGVGFIIATMSLVGQNIGALRPDDAEKDAITAVYAASFVMGVVGLSMFFFPGTLASLFTDDQTTINEASVYLRIMGISQIPLGIFFVMSGALRGAGDTRTTLVVNVISIWGFRILPAFLLVSAGVPIIWVYLVATAETCIKASVLVGIFRKGRWKTIKV